MTKRLRAIATSVIAAIALATAAVAAPQPSRMWEVASVAVPQSQPQQGGIADADAPDITIMPDKSVILTVPRRMTVEIFTILGQPVSRETLAAGTYRLRLRTKGIYILRAAGMTKRITL